MADKSICYYRGKEKRVISLETLRNEVAQFLQIDNLSFLIGAPSPKSELELSPRPKVSYTCARVTVWLPSL